MTNISRDWFSDRWCEYFSVDPSSPSGLVWKKSRGNGILEGSSAGYLTKSGHWKVELLGRAAQVHRIIYQLTFGEIPELMVIDHINGNPSDNRVGNLRAVTKKINSRNRKRAINSGAKTGVYEVHEFVANWVEGDKLRQKSFKYSEYGDEAFKMASEYRDAQIKRLNEMEYGYTEDHGVRS